MGKTFERGRDHYARQAWGMLPMILWCEIIKKVKGEKVAFLRSTWLAYHTACAGIIMEILRLNITLGAEQSETK